MSQQEIFGWIAVFLGVVGYIPYIYSIFKGQTKPHLFSWVIWTLLTAIAFFAQVADNGGPGTWVMGVMASVCFLVSILAIFYGEKEITRSDWSCLIVALMAIPLWYITETPLWSIILITVIDALGFIPTFRKVYAKPDEEQAVIYILAVFKLTISLFALTNISLITTVYPVSLVITNSLFVAMLFWRRATLKKKGKQG